MRFSQNFSRCEVWFFARKEGERSYLAIGGVWGPSGPVFELQRFWKKPGVRWPTLWPAAAPPTGRSGSHDPSTGRAQQALSYSVVCDAIHTAWKICRNEKNFLPPPAKFQFLQILTPYPLEFRWAIIFFTCPNHRSIIMYSPYKPSFAGRKILSGGG